MKPLSLAATAGRLAIGAQVFFGRKQALEQFGETRDDFLESFWYAAVLYPIFLWVAWTHSDDAIAAAGPTTRFAGHTVYYIVAWVYWPLVMATVSTMVGQPQNWIRYVVAVNWVMATPIAIQFAATILLNDAAPVLASSISIGVMLWSFIIHGWIIVKLFKTPIPLTIFLVIADLAISRMLASAEQLVILPSA